MKVINTNEVRKTFDSIKEEANNIKKAIINMNQSVCDLFSRLLKNNVKEASSLLTHALWGDEISRIKTATQVVRMSDLKKPGRYGPGVFRRKGS